MWQCTPDTPERMQRDMSMYVCIFESSQVKGSYVKGDSKATYCHKVADLRPNTFTTEPPGNPSNQGAGYKE